jgi:hypothetical protein
VINMEEPGLASDDEHDREKSREGGAEAVGSGDGGGDGEEVVNWGLLQSRPLMQLRDDAPITRKTINDIALGRASLAFPPLRMHHRRHPPLRRLRRRHLV